MLQIDWESEMKSSAKDDKAQESYKNISDEELDKQIELMKKKRMNWESTYSAQHHDSNDAEDSFS